MPKLKGGLWHPHRRKWASERMHLLLTAVADAGGWKDVTTLMKCYQHADEALLLAVMTNQPCSLALQRRVRAWWRRSPAANEKSPPRAEVRTLELPLLGSNQDSSDPEALT